MLIVGSLLLCLVMFGLVYLLFTWEFSFLWLGVIGIYVIVLLDCCDLIVGLNLFVVDCICRFVCDIVWLCYCVWCLVLMSYLAVGFRVALWLNCIILGFCVLLVGW